MNIYAVETYDMDPATRYVDVSVGRWDGVLVGKPLDVRTLVMQVPTVSESNAMDIAAIVAAQDWASTAPGTAYYLGAGGLVVQPDAPSEGLVWDFVANTWTDPRTLPELKAARWEVIKLAREAAINAPLSTPYGVFDSDPAARTNITDSVMLLQTLAAMGTPTTIDFTLANNTTVALTTTEMVHVGLLLGQKVQMVHAQGRLRREAIDAAATAAEVEAVVW